MSNDTEHDPNDRPPDQPKERADIKRRKALGQFANYTAPTTLALLLSDRAFAALSLLFLKPRMRGREDDGYLRVDYARLGLRLQTWDEWAAAA